MFLLACRISVVGLFLGLMPLHSNTNMPEEPADELYHTAGGKYTENDIIANGGMTPSQKYKGFTAVHNPHPSANDRICPITLTKAQSHCTWSVDGKDYQFCCPDCIDEFVTMAKFQPHLIKNPEEYVKED